MTKLQKTLEWCMARGDLTVTDLHHWYHRAYATVRSWAVDGKLPQGSTGQRELIYNLTSALQKAIREKRGFPVPVDLYGSRRREYIRTKRNELTNPSVSRKSVAG